MCLAVPKHQNINNRSNTITNPTTTLKMVYIKIKKQKPQILHFMLPSGGSTQAYAASEALNRKSVPDCLLLVNGWN